MLREGILTYQGEPTCIDDYLTRIRSMGYTENDLIGCAGGRMQPFHNGQFRRLKKITSNYRLVHVNIVNPDPWDTKLQEDKHSLLNNFLTYIERAEIVNVALDVLGKRATVAPYYPIDPYGLEKYWRFMPGNQHITIKHIKVEDSYDKKKFKMYLHCGMPFINLPVIKSAQRNVSGTIIRQKMLAGDNSWQILVPDFVVDVIERYRIIDRFREQVYQEKLKLGCVS